MTHRAGSAIMAASGTAQERSARAPQATTRAAHENAEYKRRVAQHAAVTGVLALDESTRSHSGHHAGTSAKEQMTRGPVTPNAIASERHSQRTANHNSPMPGVTFESNANDPVAECWTRAQSPWPAGCGGVRWPHSPAWAAGDERDGPGPGQAHETQHVERHWQHAHETEGQQVQRQGDEGGHRSVEERVALA